MSRQGGWAAMCCCCCLGLSASAGWRCAAGAAAGAAAGVGVATPSSWPGLAAPKSQPDQALTGSAASTARPPAHLCRPPDSICGLRCLSSCLPLQTSNAEAIRFYQRFGFGVGETIPGYYKRLDPPDAVVLSRRLSSGGSSRVRV